MPVCESGQVEGGNLGLSVLVPRHIGHTVHAGERLVRG